MRYWSAAAAAATVPQSSTLLQTKKFTASRYFDAQAPQLHRQPKFCEILSIVL